MTSTHPHSSRHFEPSRSWVRNLSSLLVVFGVIFFPASPASAQVATGTPPFGSFAEGPDIINLSNNNAHWDVPIFAKAGRGGFSFTYDLTYDSSVWYPVGASGSQTWQPVANWGWRGITEVALGYVSYTVTQTPTCYFGGKYNGILYNYSDWIYHDNFGVPHWFSGGTNVVQPTGQHCSSSSTSMTATTPDGSGWTLSATGSTANSVTSSAGNVIHPPINTGTGAGTGTDRNGNQINVDGSGHFYDTLSSTSPVLTAAGTAPSNTTLTYTAPSGAPAAYTIKYTTYYIQTNFGCTSPNIGDYGTNGTTTANLVTEIDLPDWNATTNPNSKYSFAYEDTPGHSGFKTGRLTSVTLPAGGTISYAYSGGNNGIVCADGSTATLTRTTPDGAWVYARTQVSGNHWKTTITDPANNQTAIDFQKDSNTTNPTNNFYETQRQVYQGSTSGTLLRQWTTCYNGNTSNCTTTAVSSPITQRNVTDQYGSSGLQCQHNYFYNSVGGLTEQDDYDYGSGAHGGLLRQILITYASLPPNITAFRQQVTVKNGSGTVVSQTTYNYDEPNTLTATSGITQHTSVSGSRGNLTSVNYPVTGLTSHFTYYDTGSPNTSQDVNGATTTYNYSNNTADCQMAFPTSISEALSMSRSMTWKCAGGVMTQLTDENLNNAYVSYTDPYYWRAASTTDQTGAVTTFCYGLLSNSTSSCTVNATQIESTLNFNSNNSTVDILTTLDGLGRTHVQQSRQSPTATTFDSVETDYDSVGRASRITLPYSGAAGQTCPSCPATNASYDPLSRISQVTNGGGGTTTYSPYSNNDVFVTMGPAPSGESTKRRQLEYDALGRLTSVCEITGLSQSGTCGQTNAQTGFWTKYTYDAISNLKGVTQNAQGTSQSRTYNYDAMSRLTSEANPESATTNYTYDSDSTCGNYTGDLVKRTDANGNVTCYQYDGLHRVTGITYPSGPNAAATSAKTFFYDSTSFSCATGANVKGRLAEAYTGPSTAKITDLEYCYSPRGEITDAYTASQSFSGYNHITKTYWPSGQLQQLSGVPGLPTIYYGASDGSGLDGEGRITKIIAASGPNPIACSTAPCVSHNAAGQVTNLIFGSGDSDSYTYDGSTGRMTQYQFNVNGQSVVGTPSWNANGTLASLNVTDPFNSGANQNCTYGYDDLARIANVNCPGAWAQTFTYDPFGNITKTGSYWWPPSGSGYDSATNRYNTSVGAQYDNNGNLLNDTFHTYQWDAEGRVTAVDVGGSNYTDYLTYDAIGNPAEYKQTYPNGPPWLAQQVFGVLGSAGTQLGYTTSTGGTNFELPLVGGAKMAGWSGTTVYGHADWLGGIRLDSTPSRTVTSDVVFAPFGEVYNSPTTYWWEFAGLAQRLTGNLWDAAARDYHADQGRWISPDPGGLAAVDPSNPQSWNRYSYVLNNPVDYVDPSGLREDMPGQCPQVSIDGNPVYDDFGGCAVGGWLVRAILSMEAGAVAPPGAQIQWDPVTGQWERYVPPLTWTTGNDTDGYVIHQIIGGWTSYDTVSNSGDWILWGYDVNTFIHGVLHGVRQPGQSFAACVNQNISDTTGGTVNPQKLATTIPATAVGLAGALMGKVPFNIPFDPGTGGISAFTASAYGLGTAFGAGRVVMGGLVGAANGVGYGLAIAGAATAGLVVGSAINCR